MTANAARQIRMQHASGRLLSAAIRTRGPAEIRVCIWLINSAPRVRTDCQPFTREDCAPGTCYEGYCLGDTVYSTDGTCGYQHGGRLCAGKWGDCCNMDGKIIMCATKPSGSIATRAGSAVQNYRTVERGGESSFSLCEPAINQLCSGFSESKS